MTRLQEAFVKAFSEGKRGLLPRPRGLCHQNKLPNFLSDGDVNTQKYELSLPSLVRGTHRTELPKPNLAQALTSTDSARDLLWQEELGIGQGLLEGLSPAGGDR